MTISIIIRAKNEEKNIGETLTKIISSKLDKSFEVILIDSGSIDKTLEIAKRNDVKILAISESEFSYGYSLNYGIQRASGDIICCISAHCIPCNDNWLSELVQPIINGEAQATFGRQVPKEGINPFEEMFLNKRFPDDINIAGRVPFSNANSAFLKELWDEVKFDEHIPGWEDYLWYLMRKDEYTFKYVPNAGVFHSHRFSLNRLAKTAYNDGMAFRYIKEKHDFDILGDKSQLAGKIKYVLKDISDHVLFFLKKGYLGSIAILPFIKAYLYINYWRGYHSFNGK